MKYTRILPDSDLTDCIRVLNESHATVAKEFGFTKETNPSNSAFADALSLQSQLKKGIELYLLSEANNAIGCIAIEKSINEMDTYYIEKVSVIPEFRHKGYGTKLMEFATGEIKKSGGKWISIALIDSNKILKQWYLMQGFAETGTRDFPQLPFRVCFMRKQLLSNI